MKKNKYLIFLLDKGYIIVPIFFGFWSLILGQDRNQDLSNYHIYNAFSFLNNKFYVDFAVADVQTYFNPLLDVFYYILNTKLPVKLFGFIMGAIHGVIFVGLLLVTKILLNQDQYKKLYSKEYIFFIAMLGCLTPNFLSGLGNSMGDNTSGIFEIFAFLIIIYWLSKAKNLPQDHHIYIAISGCLAGLGVGLKLTNAPFALAMCISFFILRGTFFKKIYLAFIYGISSIIGFLFAGGFWYFKIWTYFKNPFFPQFSNIFKNDWSTLVFESHGWAPKNLAEIFLWPFISSINYHRVGEGLVHQFLWPVFYILLLCFFVHKIFINKSLTKNKFSNLNLYLLSFIILGYIFWMLVFSIQRYIVVIEIFVPIAILILLNYFFELGRSKKIAKYLLGVSCAVIILGGFGTWGHSRWVNPPFSAEIPDLSKVNVDSSTVFLTKHGMPLSWLVSFFPPNLSFIHLSSLDKYNASKVNEIINRRKGPRYTMFAGAYNWRLDNVRTWNDIFSGLNLMRDKDSCKMLDKFVRNINFRGKIVELHSSSSKDQCSLNLLDKDTVDLNDANRLIISKNKDEFLIHKYKLDENSCKVYPARIGSQNWRYIWCSLY